MAGRRWSLLVFGAAVVTAAVVAFAPLTVTSTCVSSGEATSCSSERSSLVSGEGYSVVGVLAVPAVIALLPVVRPSRRWALVTAAALTGAVLLGAASVGIFFVPVVALAWVAVRATPRA